MRFGYAHSKTSFGSVLCVSAPLRENRYQLLEPVFTQGRKDARNPLRAASPLRHLPNTPENFFADFPRIRVQSPHQPLQAITTHIEEV